MRLLLISGIPATWKSTFGEWLEQEHGYLHVNAEKKGRLEVLGLRKLWNETVASGNASKLVAHFESENKPIVFDWGFPVVHLNVITAMIAAGFEPWWFDGDRGAALDHYAKRTQEEILTQEPAIASEGLGRMVEEAVENVFKPQVRDIDKKSSEIGHVFGDRIVKVFDQNKKHIGCKKIYKKIGVGK